MTARALLVGVPGTLLDGFAELPEARRDVGAVKEVIERRGFDDVEPVADGLTVDSFAEKLVNLRSATGPGDLAFVYFSGHGHRVPSQTEDDFTDECLVLRDGLLRDDWFHDSFWPGVQPGSQWVTCVDACFSATSVIWMDRPPTAAARPKPPPLRRASPVVRVSLSAAGDDETASGADGMFVSSWWTQTILAGLGANPGMSYKELWEWTTSEWHRMVDDHRYTAFAGLPRMLVSDAPGADALAASPALSALSGE